MYELILSSLAIREIFAHLEAGKLFHRGQVAQNITSNQRCNQL